jgi:hypothetical protein
MMLSSNACRFFLFSLLSLSANAETIRGAQRELAGEDLVNLGTADDYVILTKSGISTVSPSVITGDIAVSPIAATAMTGFELAMSVTSDFSTDTSEQVVGGYKAYASDYAVPTPSVLTTAVSDMETAYTDAAGRPNPNAARKNIGGGLLGGDFGGPDSPLTPGVYTFGSDVSLTGNIHFEGSSTAVFIIQIAGNLIQAANYNVILGNNQKAENIFWQVAGFVTVEAGAHMEGILLVKTAVTFITGSSLYGRVLAQTACDLQKATITQTPPSTV